MIKSFEEIVKKVKEQETKKVSVAVAQDDAVLEAVKAAKDNGVANAILVGNKEEIIAIELKIGMNPDDYEIIDEPNINKAALKAVEVVSTGKADMLMKGLVDTASFLRAVLNKEVGLRTGKLMSHVAVFEIPKYDRLIFLTDVAFNMYPELKDKVDIINNAVEVARAVGIEKPRVAPVCAVEVVNPGMQATIDAAMLSKMNDRGQIKNCIIDGPLSADAAFSEEACKHKKIGGDVGGKADIMLLPNIDAGNIMYKTMTCTTDSKNGCIMVGTSAPAILTSRSDSYETKLYSIALAALVANSKQ